MRPRLLVVVTGLTALALGLALVLLHSGPRRSGTNRSPNQAFVVAIGGGQAICQRSELLPADTGGMQLTIGTYGRPGPQLTIRARDAAGRELTSGTLAAGWHEGYVTVPVAHVADVHEGVEVCLRDDGPDPRAPIAIAGTKPDPRWTMTVAGHPDPLTRVRIDYYRPGKETWAELLPAIAHRMTLGKSSLIRHWAWVGAPLLMLLALALAVRLLLTGSDPAAESETR